MSDGLFDQPTGYPIRDEMTGELVEDSDGFPIAELEGHDYLELRQALSLEQRTAGERAWRYGHVIVDEAQDLTPMQWRMVARRARGRSMTLVGDLAQRTIGEQSSWTALLPPELGDVAGFELTINYRSPAEVAEVSARILADLAPELTASNAIRASGHPIETRLVDDIEAEVRSAADDETLRPDGGRLAIIGYDLDPIDTPSVFVLEPSHAKGMEFDTVIVVEPQAILDRPNGLALLYVAVTRTTDRLIVMHRGELPRYFPS